MTDGAGPGGGPSDEADAPQAAGTSAGEGPDGPPDPGPDLQRLAQDWISLWQSELAAIAVDREMHESWQAALAMWAGAASAALQAMPRARASPPADERAARRTGTKPAPGAASAAAAPDARDAEIERLARHVAELEARLAGLERGRGRGPARPPGKRKR